MVQRHKRSRIGRFFYNLRYLLGEYALRGLIVVMPWIPYRLLLLFTSFLAWVAFLVMWPYHRRMEQNIAQAMAREIPSPGARKKLVRRAWQNFARGILETCAVMHFPRDKITSTIALEGEEHLQRALARGKGVIALSAHLGSFTLIGARLAASGYAFSVVVKQPRNERFTSLVDEYRTQLGVQTISAKPRREAVKAILKALRQNRIVLVIADEFKSGGVMVEFMGRPSAAPRGPASLALRTGAATLPTFATRRPDGSLVLSIGPEVSPVQAEDIEESVAATTAIFTRQLEKAIRAYPDQWNWLGFPRDGRVLRAQYAQGSPVTARATRPTSPLAAPSAGGHLPVKGEES